MEADMTAIAPATVTTAEELLRLPTGMGMRYELVNGELKTMSPAGSKHGRIAAHIGSLLDQFVRSEKLGEVFGAETGFILRRKPDTVRAPDAAFVSAARIPADGLPDGYFPGAPDLAVEVVSPDETAQEIQIKVGEYFEAGARLIWVVYPRTQEVVVFRSARKSDVLSAEESLDGGDAIPGFSCPVKELFA
jgi:Uma2 family endonuclease